MSISSFFGSFGKGVKKVGDEVVKVSMSILSVGAKVVKVVEEVETLTPDFKSSLATLVDDVKAIAVAVAPAVASEGTNVAVDAAAAAAVFPKVKALIVDFEKFVPILEAAIAKLQVETK